ncbi:MAG: winged helix DNA-binding domain-containing protein [Pseudonocardiales bacterium]|nr:winged helix DNA-binding domain-containing protein [Pseudonocardiales bacterium]
MSERVLSRERLLRALLARQLLLERAPLTPERAVERVGLLQTQHAPSAYLGLWSRLAGFRRADLTDALHRRRVVQAWVMRCTIHMASAADFGPLSDAVRAQRRALFRRTTPGAADLDMPAAAAVVRDLLADGPLRQSEIVDGLLAAGFPKAAFTGIQLWLDLVRVPPAGTWELPRAHVYGLASTWLRRSAPVDLAAAEERLATRYLRGFGPATPGDLARYAGWTITEAKAVLERLTLRRFRDPDGRLLLDLPRAPLPDADAPTPVRFLGRFDAVLLLGHATRTQILPAEHRHHVFATTKPQSVPTFLVDGRVAGTWRFTGEDVEVSPFAPLAPAARDEVDAEARRLAEFHRTG